MILKKNFVYSKMTNARDADYPQVYSQMKFVEFLDFLGRVAIDYFDVIPNGPPDLEDKTL